MSEDLRIDERRHRGTITLELSGELGAVGAEQLSSRLDALRRTYRGRLVIDLRGLTFVESTGIAVLAHAYNYAQRDGWVLELGQGPAAVRKVFEICGLENRLPFIRG